MTISPDVEALRDDVIALRRAIHRRPERAFEEHETAALVARELKAAGIEATTGLARTGVVGLIEGTSDGKTLMLRADMDALSLDEETGAEYASELPGRMHACGHDAHVAMLLTAARVLVGRRDRLRGRVKLVFQPAEEGAGGAGAMIEEGVLRDPPVDAAVGLHVWNDIEAGCLGVRPGPVMAATDEFRITVEGVGGHGAYPHQTVDPVLTAAHIVVGLQAIVSRNVSPVDSGVVSIGTLRAGTADNIIPARADMTGTLRSYRAETRELLLRRMQETARGIAAAHGAEVSFELDRGYPATVNDPTMVDLCTSVAEGIFGPDGVVEAEQSMGGEDMSLYLEQVPGCFLFLGTRNEARGLTAPHHNPAFDIDESALPAGVELLVRTAEAYLG